MTDDSFDDDLGLKVGAIIESRTEKYVIISLLGEGGFGAVFKVHKQADKSQEYALKVEKKVETRKHSKLKMEIAILKLVSELRAERSHFTKIVDRGKKPNYYFLVMQLVGKSLEELKAPRPHKIFSIGTGLGVAIQCLEAVEDLHTHGFIHRDLKPANYACGLPPQQHVVFILDFGIARKIVKANDELKTPRGIVGFKGTTKFASLACHKNEDMSKKDDCEGWFYLLIDMVASGGLPWKKIKDKNDVKESKMRSRVEGNSEFEALYKGITKCQPNLVKIINYIDGLKYVETPDYEFIYKMLKEAASKCNVNVEDPYDWEKPE